MGKATRWVVAVAGTAVVAVAGAADPAVAEERPLLFEVAGLGSLVTGGQFKLQDAGIVDTGTGSRATLADHGGFALAADLRADAGSSYELFYSREVTDLSGYTGIPHTGVTVEYLHLGGVLQLTDDGNIKPFADGGLGVTRLMPGEAGNTDTRFSASLGLGLKWPITRQFSLRLEGRGFVTLVNDNTAVFCSSGSAGLLCRIHGNGRTFIQGQLLAGAAFAF